MKMLLDLDPSESYTELFLTRKFYFSTDCIMISHKWVELAPTFVIHLVHSSSVVYETSKVTTKYREKHSSVDFTMLEDGINNCMNS